jgi:Flp pilus assembly protein TadD
LCIFSCQIVYGQTQAAVDARTKGYKLQQDGDLNDAQKEYLKAAQLDPAYAAPHNDLGVLYEEKGEIKNAEQAYLKAIAIDSNYAGVYSNLAALYEQQRQTDKALYYWKKRSMLGNASDPWTQKAVQKVSELSDIPLDLGQSVPATSAVTTPASTKSTAALKSSANKVISAAKKDIRNKRYQDAIEKLQQAKTLTDDTEPIDKMLTETRGKVIDEEISKASFDGKIYKKAKLLEVEDTWYPPIPEPDAGKVTVNVESLSSRSPARLILEKKARQIIPSIDFTDARLKDVVEYLALSNDINIVIDEEVVADVSGVTIHLKNMPLIEALDIILRTKALRYRFEDNIIWITTGEKLAQEDLTIKVYDVQDLIGKIQDFPSKPFDISKAVRNADDSEGDTGDTGDNNA